ncbi:hypothetical protein B0T26DRAFT_488089 [Lasiosphaeria miniovina]|uniref:Rhodopsin domain-containing protein n=1 Tax=Lasiosphaeria miniovina TaxID=1954250 RepID=A0AA39ZSV0_9PEZI|nr:uncharacterized protein B0T26DRAFT_488089 [Lasiosphaeria miniovina]KAK0703001.1 hypothetical protein B0T26DRAFT_488089 [Lasiosphaeria miniovina]
MTLYPPSIVLPIYGVFAGVGVVLTCLRFWVRLSYAPQPFPNCRLYLDDYFIVLGLVVVCACTGIQFYNGIEGGAGAAISAHSKDDEALVELKVDFAMIVIEKIAFGAIKLSLLYLCRRIFGFWDSFRRYNNALIVLIVAWTLSFFLADLLLCGPHPELEVGLDQQAAARGCGDKGALLIAFAATSVVTDLLVLVLPLPYIWRLPQRPAKKVMVCFVFLLGGISTLAGILRLVFLSVAYPTGRLNFGYVSRPGDKGPYILQAFNPTFWVMVEMCLGVWAANLPALAPLVRGINEKYKASSLYRKLSSSGLSDSATKPSSNKSAV